MKFVFVCHFAFHVSYFLRQVASDEQPTEVAAAAQVACEAFYLDRETVYLH